MRLNKSFLHVHSGIHTVICAGILVSTTFSNALTLDDALEQVESSNPGLEMLREQQTAAAARVQGAAALPNPNLQLTYFGESVETRTGPQEWVYSISQTAPWPEKLRTRKFLAQKNADAANYRYENGLSMLRRNITHHYVELAYLGKAAQSLRENLDLIDDMYSIVEVKVGAGSSLNQLLRLEVEKERVRDHLDVIQVQHLEERALLAAMLSVEADTFDEVFPFPEKSFIRESTAWTDRLEQSNPELKLLRQQIAGLGDEVKLSRLERLPDFTFGLNYIQIGSESVVPDAGNDPWSVTLGMTLPIWESKNRATIRASKADKRAYEYHYRERKLQLRAELSSLLARHKDNEQRVQRYKNSLIPLAEQALENSRNAYENNQISVLELIDSERALLELKVNYWRALANVLQADAGIRALVGDLD